MKPNVIIHSIGSKYILEDDEYEFILANLNKPLPLAQLWWTSEGALDHVTVHFGNKVLLLFRRNNVEGEFLNGIKFQLC